jgi:hydroxyacylglutathione hydrolase
MNKKTVRKIATLVLILAFGCNQTVKTSGVQNSHLSKWFSSKEVAPGVWVIDDHGSDNFYLVEGEDSALLIDNGLGVANVRDYVASLTNLPLIVVNTHGHPDHAGANYQYPVVYAHLSDFEQIKQCNLPEQHKKMINNTQIPEDIAFKDTLNLIPTVLKPVDEGYVFDLGERQLEVIHVPGHTPGCICLLDGKNKILFTGDNSNTISWLFLQNCEPIDVYLESLLKLKNKSDEFDLLLPGHGEPLDKAFIVEEIKCVESILDGSCQPEPYNSFAGKALLCTFKRAGIAYNPDNIHSK